MKIQCVLCKEIVEIGAFEPSGDGVRISCAACGESFFLPMSGSGSRPAVAAAPSASSPTPAGNASSDCPKCGIAVGEDLVACGVCGLSREHFASFARDARRDEDDDLEELWLACEADWGEPENHERFVARASKIGQFAAAARHYRQVIKARPADEIAVARLERVTRMAEVALLTKRPEAIEEPVGAYKGVVILLVLMLLLGGIAGIYALTKSKDSGGAKGRSPAGQRSSPPR